MAKFIELFSIVPIGDGFHYLCRDDDGNYFQRRKIDHSINERLIFESEVLAQNYIDKYLDAERYMSECILYREDYAPKNIIREV